MVDWTLSPVDSNQPSCSPSPFYPAGPQPLPTWGLTKYKPLVPWVLPIEIWVKTEEVVEVHGKCKVRDWQEDARTWAEEQKDQAQSHNQSWQSSYYRDPSSAISISSSAWSRAFPCISPASQLACQSKPLKNKLCYKKCALKKLPDVLKMTLEERVMLLSPLFAESADSKTLTSESWSASGMRHFMSVG